MSCGCLFSNADAAAFGIMDDVIFHDPSLAPVGTQKARLVSCGRCPRAGGLSHLKAPHRNIIHACFLRVETALAHIDLSQFFVRVSALEVGVDICVFMVSLSVPLMNGPCCILDRFRMFCPRRIVSLCADLGIFHLI